MLAQVHLGDELSFRERLDLCTDVARGVAYIHSRDIVHADLKSGNVLVSGQLTAMLADLGASAHARTRFACYCVAVVDVCPQRPPPV